MQEQQARQNTNSIVETEEVRPWLPRHNATDAHMLKT